MKKKQSRLFLLLLVRLKVWEWRFACLTSSKRTKPAYYLDPCENLVLKVTVKLDGLTYPERTYYVCNRNTDKVSIGEYYIITLDAGETETKSLRLTTKCIGE